MVKNLWKKKKYFSDHSYTMYSNYKKNKSFYRLLWFCESLMKGAEYLSVFLSVNLLYFMRIRTETKKLAQLFT